MSTEPTHLRPASPEELPGEWRNGTDNPWTIYVVTGEPTKQQPYVGCLLTPEASAMAVRDHNAFLAHVLALGILREALHLHQNGEKAAGGTEAWAEWGKRAESFLRAGADAPEDRAHGYAVTSAWDAGIRAERERIAKGATEMATTLTRPGMGNGPLHGEQVRVIPLDDLLDLINDDAGERT